MAGLAARLALVATAVAAVAVLALWLSATVEYERAVDAVDLSGRPPVGALVEETERRLRRAAERTPAAEPELALAQLQLLTNQRRQAVRVLGTVVRREPENASAWGLLGLALERADPARSDRAKRREWMLRGSLGRP